MKTGQYIKQLREAKGIKRATFAKQCDINRTSLVMLEDYNEDGRFKDVCRLLLELGDNPTHAYLEIMKEQK